MSQNSLFYFIRFGHRDDNAMFHELCRNSFKLLIFGIKINDNKEQVDQQALHQLNNKG